MSEAIMNDKQRAEWALSIEQLRTWFDQWRKTHRGGRLAFVRQYRQEIDEIINARLDRAFADWNCVLN